MKLNGRTIGFAALHVKPKEGFAKEGRTKNPFGRLPFSPSDNTATIAMAMGQKYFCYPRTWFLFAYIEQLPFFSLGRF
ncbi:MAG: hypothetical protein DSY83_11915 [Flavobacteriia bacterium]|nr:MAG: hypothetical protein DSY83_11915 [Flavobacteriia bacterium]